MPYGAAGYLRKGWERARFTSFVEFLPVGYVYHSTPFVIPLGGEADLFNLTFPNARVSDLPPLTPEVMDSTARWGSLG